MTSNRGVAVNRIVTRIGALELSAAGAFIHRGRDQRATRLWSEIGRRWSASAFDYLASHERPTGSRGRLSTIWGGRLRFATAIAARPAWTRASTRWIGEMRRRETYAFSLREAQTDGAYDRYRVGIHHVAFEAPSRRVVDERLAWARQQGLEIESDPTEYGYQPGYYAGFFYDPDGIKLEIMHAP